MNYKNEIKHVEKLLLTAEQHYRDKMDALIDKFLDTQPNLDEQQVKHWLRRLIADMLYDDNVYSRIKNGLYGTITMLEDMQDKA